MRNLLALILIVFPVGAFAHPGHIVEVAGHNHWIAAGAIGAAVLAALWGKLKEHQEDGEVEEDQELEEEAA